MVRWVTVAAVTGRGGRLGGPGAWVAVCLHAPAPRSRARTPMAAHVLWRNVVLWFKQKLANEKVATLQRMLRRPGRLDADRRRWVAAARALHLRTLSRIGACCARTLISRAASCRGSPRAPRLGRRESGT